jgi:ribonucleoside-triphosphate reductase
VKEFEMRREYEPEHSGYTPHQETKEAEVEKKTPDVGLDKGIYLFGTKTCPKCKAIKNILEDKGIAYTYLDASENADLVDKLDIYQAPSMVVQDEDGLRVLEGFEKVKQALKTMI